MPSPPRLRRCHPRETEVDIETIDTPAHEGHDFPRRPVNLWAPNHNGFGRVPSDGFAIHPCTSAARACLGASSRKVL